MPGIIFYIHHTFQDYHFLCTFAKQDISTSERKRDSEQHTRETRYRQPERDATRHVRGMQ